MFPPCGCTCPRYSLSYIERKNFFLFDLIYNPKESLIFVVWKAAWSPELKTDLKCWNIKPKLFGPFGTRIEITYAGDPDPLQPLDFNNTEVAFSFISLIKELAKTVWLFSMMNNNSLVQLFSKVGLWAIKLHIYLWQKPLLKYHFPPILRWWNAYWQPKDHRIALYEYVSKPYWTMELKEKKHRRSIIMLFWGETLKAIEWAASNNSVPIVSTKYRNGG